ncbi:MAG: cohesin domain-containing protein [bacterium]
MTKLYSKILIFFSIFIALSMVAVTANAATLYLLPESRAFGIGQEFSVSVKVDTDDVNINATQVTVQFPNDILEVVGVDKVGSVFTFWVEEPIISNENGVVSFIGGTMKGIAGDSLNILKIRFKTIGSGIADITATQAVVTASDGKGTNVLSTINGTNVSVGANVVAPEPIAPPTFVPTEPIEIPEVIVREAVKATVLPSGPAVRVPLYPDQNKWYNHQGETIALWDLPDDVVQISTRLSQSKDKLSGEKDEELYTGKNFGVVEEGEWFIRVQFKNNIDWGELAYYRIGIDTTPPLPFEIVMDNNNTVTDNPTPEIRFETQDSLSGISHSLICIDNNEPIRITDSVLQLPTQGPGKHNMRICIFDNAGNSVEDVLEFEILPLPTPVIDFVTKSIIEEEQVFIFGTAISDGNVDVIVFDDKDKAVYEKTVDTNSSGNWESVIEGLPRGKYTLIATARDDRGATSFPTELISLKIKVKPVISFGLIDLGWLEIIIVIALLIISISGTTTWYYISIRRRREAYRTIIGRDVVNMCSLMANGLKNIDQWVTGTKLTPAAKNEAQIIIKKMYDTVLKNKRYLGKEIDEIK